MSRRPSRVTPMRGLRFGDLIVLENKGSGDRGYVRWLCRCVCGTEVIVDGDRLRSGRQILCNQPGRHPKEYRLRSRGAATKEFRQKYKFEYGTWAGMRARCLSKTAARYADYGGRGIKMHGSWQESFPQFILDVGPRPSRAHSLDRIDVNGNYEPGNVRWAPRSEEASNQRKTIFIEYGGKQVRLAELAKKHDLSSSMLNQRLRWGWTLEDALTLRPNTKAARKKKVLRDTPVAFNQPNMLPQKPLDNP